MGSSTQSSHVSSLGSVESEGEELMSSSLGMLPDTELILEVGDVVTLGHTQSRLKSGWIAHFFWRVRGARIWSIRLFKSKRLGPSPRCGAALSSSQSGTCIMICMSATRVAGAR